MCHIASLHQYLIFCVALLGFTISVILLHRTSLVYVYYGSCLLVIVFVQFLYLLSIFDFGTEQQVWSTADCFSHILTLDKELC